MPLPRSVARFNRQVTNRLMMHLADRPPFAVLAHRGRTTGALYRIPINAFPDGDRFVFALTYGSGSDWVKNVLAHGEAGLCYDGDEIRLVRPRLVGTADVRPVIPAPARFVLGLIRVDEFLVMDRG